MTRGGLRRRATYPQLLHHSAGHDPVVAERVAIRHLAPSVHQSNAAREKNGFIRGERARDVLSGYEIAAGSNNALSHWQTHGSRREVSLAGASNINSGPYPDIASRGLAVIPQDYSGAGWVPFGGAPSYDEYIGPELPLGGLFQVSGPTATELTTRSRRPFEWELYILLPWTRIVSCYSKRQMRLRAPTTVSKDIAQHGSQVVRLDLSAFYGHLQALLIRLFEATLLIRQQKPHPLA
jgi:hypothetical protein